MSYTRVTETPIHHVFAEMAAFPLASAEALKNPLIALVPFISGGDPFLPADAATARLWRDAEKYLLRSCSAFSVEEMVALRDELWFDLYHEDGKEAEMPRGPAEIPLTSYVRRLASRCISCAGNQAFPKTPFSSRPGNPEEVHGHEALARRDWRWLNFALPADFLVAAHGGWNCVRGRVDLLSPWLRQRLQDEGFAQSHVHMKGDFDFGLLWARAADVIVSAECPEMVGASPGAELDEGRQIGPRLLCAMIARYVMGWYLQERAADSSVRRFAQFLKQQVRQVFFDVNSPSDYVLLRDGLSDLAQGSFAAAPPWLGLQAAYNTLRNAHRDAAETPPNHFDELLGRDPLSVFFPAGHVAGPSSEMCFIARALEYLEGRGPPAMRDEAVDVDFARLFWQVVRVRNILYRHVVQRPQTPGLQWFLRFYNRIGPIRGKLRTNIYVEASSHFGGVTSGLRSLEVRTGLESDHRSMSREIATIREGWRQVLKWRRQKLGEQFPDGHAGGESLPRALPEFGLVLHFIRDRRGGTLEGLPNRGWERTAADPSLDSNGGYRYGDFYRDARQRAIALGHALREDPLELFIVRGVDVCTDELGVPTWVLRPLLRYVRQCGRQARDHLFKHAGIDVPPLRTTIHAGEDFVHLLTGLRNLDCTIKDFDLREGDRIGHGLSLGVDPQSWSLKSNRIPMPIECRLQDLVWELGWYCAAGTEPQTGRWHWVEEEICRLSKAVFGTRIHWQVLLSAHDHLLHEKTLAALLGFPDYPRPPAERRARGNCRCDSDPLSIAHRYLTDTSVFHRAHQIIWVNHLAEAPVVKQLQSELRKEVCERGLTIEVNPTSNLLIGDFHDLVHHPLWRLKPPRKLEGLAPVSLCIGSDDPLNFATTLPEEFQFVLDAAILAGLSHDDAHRWLDEVRQTGLDVRFTIPQPDPGFDDSVFPATSSPPQEPP